MPEHNPMVRLRAHPTRKKAIDAMCAHCMGCTDDHMEPGFKAMVRNCTSYKCPLYEFRPFQKKEPKDAVAHIEI